MTQKSSKLSAGLKTPYETGGPESSASQLSSPEVSVPLSQLTYESLDIRMSHLGGEQAGSWNDVKRRAGQERPVGLGNASPSQPTGIFPRCWDAPSFLSPILRPLSLIARLSHTAWFIFRKLDPTSKRKRGMGGRSYTRCPNPALKQKLLGRIHPRSGRGLLSRRVFFFFSFFLF